MIWIKWVRVIVWEVPVQSDVMMKWIKNLFKNKKDKIVPPISANNWSVSSTTGRIVYKIPVGNLGKKQLLQLMNNYKNNYWFPSPNFYYNRIDKIKRILNRIQPKEG